MSQSAHVTGHEKHCFVVMPFGREPQDQRWFKGWYEVVIHPAVLEAGYEPKLSAAEEQPGAINDEIRGHLAVDPMVVVDLGGTEPDDDPNPNVMYELGIRHALGLPVVVLAWKGQRLPFDVSNQRVIMESRDLVDLETNRKRLSAFIHAAEEGRFYKPMEAVARIATIAAASASLGEDSLLRALAQEVRDLRTVISSVAAKPRKLSEDPGPATMKKMTRHTLFRRELYPHFVASGGHPVAWSKILREPIPAQDVDARKSWKEQEWRDYVASRAKDPVDVNDLPIPCLAVDDAILAQIRAVLPPQPWPNSIHRQIASQIGLPTKTVWDAIAELIKRGEFQRQVDGKIVTEPGDTDGISRP